VIGNLFIPKSPENYTYDADGNLTSDGRFTNIWDADNRLTNITSLSGDPTGSLVKLDFTYDYMGRRIQKIVSTNSGSGWTASYTNKFIYDGWNLVAVLDGGNHLLQSFTWGSDLSGSLQGAGGVGGLISTTVYGGANTGAYFPGYDGNGNVGALVSANNGLVDASYEYGPFGELLRATGPVAFSNPFRFSTKFQDDETGIIMYPRRPYSASTGRFLTRDPIDEDGGVNLYGLVANNPVNENDPLGLCNIKIRCNPVVEGFITVGWHCGVIGPDGQTYELGGVGVAGSSGGHPVIYPNPTYPDTPPDHYKDYPVSCNGCCGSVLACIQTFTAAAQLNPPTYYALWQNSNTYAHKMLNTCGCSVDPIPLCYTVLRSPRQGGPYTVCTTTTTPPHAVAW
jgi:RHS repeat-associated protein